MNNAQISRSYPTVEHGMFEGFQPQTRLDAIAAKTYGWIERTATKILWCIENRPKSTRLVLASVFFLLAILSYRHVAHAQTTSGQTPNHLLQDEVTRGYAIALNFNILQNSLTIAQYFFATLAALTVIVNVLAYYIRSQTIVGLGQVVLSSILRLGIPFVVIGLAPSVVPAISLIGLQLAGDVSGQANSYSSYSTNNIGPDPGTVENIISALYNETFGQGVTAIDVSPSNIAQFGENIGFTIIDQSACVINGGTWTPTDAQPCYIASQPNNDGTTYNSNDQVMQTIIVLSIGIIGTFIFIAVELVIAYLQVYLILPVAAFSLGFLGSPATRRFGENYWTLVVGTLLKFVTIVFTIGFAITIANDWAVQLGTINLTPSTSTTCSPMSTTTCQATTNTGALKVAIGYSMAAFSLLYIIRVLPSLFGGLLSGNVGSADGSQAEYQTQGVGARGVDRGLGGGSGAGLARTGRATQPGSTMVGGSPPGTRTG
jgi:hypothetical protein